MEAIWGSLGFILRAMGGFASCVIYSLTHSSTQQIFLQNLQGARIKRWIRQNPSVPLNLSVGGSRQGIIKTHFITVRQVCLKNYKNTKWNVNHMHWRKQGRVKGNQPVYSQQREGHMPQRAWSVRNLSYEKRAVNDPSGGWELEGKRVCHAILTCSDFISLHLCLGR